MFAIGNEKDDFNLMFKRFSNKLVRSLIEFLNRLFDTQILNLRAVTEVLDYWQHVTNFVIPCFLGSQLSSLTCIGQLLSEQIHLAAPASTSTSVFLAFLVQ